MTTALMVTNNNDILLGKFRLMANGIEVKSKPTFEEWEACGKFIKQAEGAVHWWIGDWLNLGEKIYGETYTQAESATGYETQTLMNDKWVASKFEISLRKENVSWQHHHLVAAVEPRQRAELLDKAESYLLAHDGEQMPIREFRNLVKFGEIGEAKPLTAPNVYNVLLADPPWQYDNTGVHGAADNHYPTMPLEDICALPRTINLKVADNAVLFLWVTNPFVRDAFEVIDSWGFEYKTNIAWVKTELKKPGSGFYVRGRHELLYICTHGSFTPLEDVSPPIGSVIHAPVQEHSRKPLEVYEIIERLYPNSQYMELFARNKRKGWDAWGNEL